MRNLRFAQWGILGGVLLYLLIAFVLPVLITVAVMLLLIGFGWYLCSKYYVNFDPTKKADKSV